MLSNLEIIGWEKVWELDKAVGQVNFLQGYAIQVKRFNPGFLVLWVFLFWLFFHILSKSVASISGTLAEDYIWKSESSNRWREKSVISAIIKTR